MTPERAAQQDEAFSRFREIYRQRREIDAKLEAAAKWILERFAPYRIGEIVVIPTHPATKGSGRPITVTGIKLDCDPRTGRVHWCVAGDGGFFRRPVGSEMPVGRTSEQTNLF